MSSAREKGLVEKPEPPSGGRDRREPQAAIYLRGCLEVDPSGPRCARSSMCLTSPPHWSRKIEG
jgi:hypothetical protein